MKSIRVLNTTIYDTDMDTFLAEWRSGILYTPNVDHLVLLQKDREFYDAYAAADHRILDSRVLLFLSQFRKESFRTNIAGVDLFPRFCELHRDDAGVRLFIVAGVDNDGERIRTMINQRIGREIVVGTFSPSFGFEDDPEESAEIINRIRKSGATALAVGVGAPKQEKWIHRHRSSLTHLHYIMGVGATFDFMLGKQRRAPRWMQRIGLEWFFRLLGDPRRFAGRYLIRDTQYFLYYMKDCIGLYRDPFAGRQGHDHGRSTP